MKIWTRLFTLVTLASAVVITGCNHNTTEAPTTDAEEGIEVIEVVTTQAVDPFEEYIVHPLLVRELGMNVSWNSPVGLRAGEEVHSVAIGEEHLAVMTDRNMLKAFDVMSGEAMWVYPVREPGEETSRPVIYENNTYVVSQSRMWIFDGDLNRPRELMMDHTVTTKPLMIDRELAIMCSARGRVYWMDLRFGFAPSDRTYQMRGGIMADPIMIGSTALISDVTGDVAVFNARSGNIIWREQLFDRISTQPVASETMVYITSEDQTLYAMGAKTGDIIWKKLFEIPLKTNPYLMADHIFLYIPEGKYLGTNVFDAGTGEPKWTLDFDARPIMERGKEVFLWSDKLRTLYIVNIDSGKLIKKAPMPDVKIVIRDKMNPGVLFLIGDNGHMMRIAPQKKIVVPGRILED